MKYKFAALITAFLTASALFTACSGKDRSGSMPTSVVMESSEEEPEGFVPDPNAEPVSGARPVISISNAEGKPGETVDVTVSINGADQKWAMCGVHFAYPEALMCSAEESDANVPLYERGEASSNLTAFETRLWLENKTDELVQNGENSVFFAAISGENSGLDGDIVTYSFMIPEDAAAGTVYTLRFFYNDGDMFYDSENDPAMQSYAFTHWQNGSITVV